MRRPAVVAVKTMVPLEAANVFLNAAVVAVKTIDADEAPRWVVGPPDSTPTGPYLRLCATGCGTRARSTGYLTSRT